MTPPHGNGTKSELAQACQDHCMGPDGPGGAIKAQVDKWRGAVALGAWVAGAGLGLLAIVVSVGLALMPSLVRSAVATSSAQVVPGLVDTAVSAALRRHGIALQTTPEIPHGASAETPSGPWLVRSAHAETKGSP